MRSLSGPVLRLLLLGTLACRSHTRDEPAITPTTAAATPAAGGDAPVPAEAGAPPAVDAAPAGPAKSEAQKAEERRARAAAALARIPEIKDGLAKLRKLSFKIDVPAQLQETKDFREYVHRELDKELPPARAEAMSIALTQLGLLATPVDLRKTFEDALVGQAGAYYDPELRKYFLVMVPTSDVALDTITAHELTHALQDQYFDLKSYYPHDKKGLPTIDQDAMAARAFVVEGEATFAMIAYVAGAMSKADVLSKKLLPVLQTQLEMMGGMSIDQLRAMNQEQQRGLGDMGDEIKAAIDSMDKIPLTLLVPLLESYTRGALPIYFAYREGGWPEVAKLYQHPPESTEQVLHPNGKLYPTRDLPKKVTLPAMRGYQLVHSDTLGELQWRVYFLLWDKAVSNAAAAGWDGDRFAVLRDKAGGLLTLVATTWDSEDEAKEFEAAYRQSLVARFGGDGQKRADGGAVIVLRRGAEVLVADGSGAAEAMKALERGVKISER
jgi:hypothetical protein